MVFWNKGPTSEIFPTLYLHVTSLNHLNMDACFNVSIIFWSNRLNISAEMNCFQVWWVNSLQFLLFTWQKWYLLTLYVAFVVLFVLFFWAVAVLFLFFTFVPITSMWRFVRSAAACCIIKFLSMFDHYLYS